jgi:uncharacterized protein (DUF362 family)
MHKHPNIHRRQFLKAAAAALTLGGCVGQANSSNDPAVLAPATEAQLAWRKKGQSTVGLIKCESYEENIFKQIKPYLAALALPNLTGKTVVLKPNMVEWHPGKPITTNPAVIKAAVELVDYLGAKEIIIGEGPGHMRDTEFLLNNSGIGKMVNTLGLRFVDLNLDDLEKVPNPDNFSGINYFYLPKTIVHADAVVSLPKLKTHHWVGATCSMKNMFGTVPGRRYGWPKNILHNHGIPNCIIDLVHLVKPAFALVDAIVAMEGDGPINGTAKDTGYLALGTDLAAVDATCIRTMNIPLEQLSYIRRAGQVIGNIDPAHITVIGSSVTALAQDFIKPITLTRHELLAESTKSAS